MMMIDTLTPAQVDRMAEYRDKWIQIGLCTEPANRPLAEEGIRQMYAIANLPTPRIMWCTSPIANILTQTIMIILRECPTSALKDTVRDSVRDSVGQNVQDSVHNIVRTSVRNNVRDSVRGSAWRSVLSNVQDSVWRSVRQNVQDSVQDTVRVSVRDSAWTHTGARTRNSVGESVWDRVLTTIGHSVFAAVRDGAWDHVKDSVKDSVNDGVWNSGYGQHDAHWLAFYDYFHDVCGLKTRTHPLQGLWLQAQHAGWYLPCHNICWVAERHTTLHRNARGQLHCLDGLACGYPDGWGVYALNGVRMDEWMVMTPVAQLSADQVFQVSNVDQRRELIRRIGIERFVRMCAATVLERSGDYELLKVPLSSDIPDARFLKMKNPSMPGVYHIEGVHPTCQTIQQAINWRASGDPQEPWHPTVLT